jgi:hypothetical protein
MAALRGCALLLFIALSSRGQPTQPVPVFNRDGIGAIGRSANVLAPGMVLTLYGAYLAPEPVCGQPAVKPAPQLCGVRVLLGEVPAELLYVSAGQINFTIPDDAPTESLAPLRVCVGELCSLPLPMWFSTRTALLSQEKPAYVHMPVWIRVDPPPPFAVSYPCWNGPWMPPGYRFEVSRSGELMAPIEQPPFPAIQGTADPCKSMTSGSSLPLHLLYRFDESGTYSIRLTAAKEGQVLYRSGWTDIVVGPSSEERRDAWLRSLQSGAETNSWSIVSETIPSLLASPDEKTLAVLLTAIPADLSQCSNFDCIKLAFGRAALAWFDDKLLRAQIPPDRLRKLCGPEGNCR